MSKISDKEAESRQLVLEKLKRMTPKEVLQAAIDAGIYDAKGKLTKKYRDPSTKQILAAFERCYKLPAAKDLLQPIWRKLNAEPKAPHSTGFCYIAAEAAYHIFKINNDVKSFCAAYEEDGTPMTHWWITVNGKILDPTRSQYTKTGEQPPYHLGVGRGFLTRGISKRAKLLTELVQQLI